MKVQIILAQTLRGFTYISFWILFFSGIGRGDVKMKKYFNFAQDSTFDCIGEVYTKKGKFILSCVLITNNYVYK